MRQKAQDMAGGGGYDRTYSYSKLLPLSFIAACLLFLVLILYFSTLSESGMDLFVAFACVTIVIVLAVLGVSPMMTSHEISGNMLILRQGWYFKRGIRFSLIEGAELYAGKTPGLSIKYQKSLRRLYVLTNEKRLVTVLLQDEVPMRVMLRTLPVKEIVVNVDEPELFIEAVEVKAAAGQESLAFRRKVGLGRI